MKLKLIIALLYLSLNGFGLTKPIVDTFGTWGYMDGTSTNLDSFKTYNIQGIHYLFLWKDIRPKYDSAYNFSIVTAKIDSAIAHNIYCSLQFNVGDNSPQWVYDSVGYFYTVGVPAHTGPWPKYYLKKYQDYYYQFLRDIGNYLAGLSQERIAHVLFWQIAEGSTGDGQPYKGVLDSCQVADSGCSTADSIAQPALGDTLIPQDRFEFKWEQYRRSAWDTAALCAGYTAVNSRIALMFNTGNSGNDLEFAGTDNTNDDDDQDDGDYIRGHFSFLPIAPWVKSGTLSHIYSFRGERSHFARIKTPDRGELQGPLKLTTHPHKELFALVCSALAGDLHMLNIDQGFMDMKEAGEIRTDHRMTDFFTQMTSDKTSAFSMPALKVDYGDTITYPTNMYGPLIAQDSASQDKFQRRLYSYQLMAQQYGSGKDFEEWQYWKAVDHFINPDRAAAINLLFPQAAFGNMRDSLWWNDHVLNASYNYEKNMHQTNATTNYMVPVYRVGPDTSIYGRFAGKPKLDSNNKCIWLYDIDNSRMRLQGRDSVQIDIVYLDNNSGGKIAVNSIVCGQKKQQGTTTTINTNTGQWKTKSVVIPNFWWKKNGVDFEIDFDSGANTTIGMVQVKNLSK